MEVNYDPATGGGREASTTHTLHPPGEGREVAEEAALSGTTAELTVTRAAAHMDSGKNGKHFSSGMSFSGLCIKKWSLLGP